MSSRSLEEAAFRPREIARLEQLAEDQERRAERWDRFSREATAVAYVFGLGFLEVVALLFSPLPPEWQPHPWLAQLCAFAAILSISVRFMAGPPQARDARAMAVAYRRDAEALWEEHATLRTSLKGATGGETPPAPAELPDVPIQHDPVCCDEGRSAILNGNRR